MLSSAPESITAEEKPKVHLDQKSTNVYLGCNRYEYCFYKIVKKYVSCEFD